MRRVSGGMLVLLIVGGTGCSSNDPITPAGPTSASATVPTSATSSPDAASPAFTKDCTESEAVDLTGDDPFRLVIKDFKFTPDCFIVSVTASVAITNKDDVAHTFSIDGTLVQAPLKPGRTYRHGPSTGFLEPGVAYPFHCSIHPQITGTMIVV